MPTIIGNSETRVGSGRINSRKGTPVFEETYSFIVEADNKSQTRAEILFSTSGLPQVNVTTGPGGYTVCRGVNAVRRDDHSLIWDVTADFSSEIEQGTLGDESYNPTGFSDPQAWIPVYETKFERYQEVVKEDQAGNPFVNSAGQAFETGLSITRHIPIWEFWQFEASSVSDEDIIARSETVNSSTFKGRAAKTLLCVVMSSVVGFYYGQKRRLTQYQLKYKKNKWTLKMLDIGTRHLENGGTNMVPYQIKVDQSGAYTDAGNLITIAGPLDGAGLPAGGYDTGTDYAVVNGSDPFPLEFDQYATNTFTFIRI